ncbi:peptidyl-prolyl cis-trans isomerase SurA [Tenacibaculum sp. MAR_2009_124]|uniref:peptidylprolyl isomerase n=1 Tax=Tenacibaculum sp. MAR_2009_124 TaxID=1250059 RepID=UPI000895CBE3|nr:peptidylprolyl isomerase [Tenacibaculum sp. MAR_2009_124]SEC94422.1 peptidyl-prolyl cis-trans isomerase SurA [Tenacibaculum sp. MAR_2009_124]
MKNQILGIVILLQGITTTTFAQKKDKELFRINNNSVMVSEFKRVYEKNLGLVVDNEAKDIDNYLNLYINYKLKVKEAYNLKLDTLKSYQNELEGYKNQLIAPYLQDKEALEKLVKDAYYRTVNEIRASHLLIKVSQKANAKDTLEAYNRILGARERIIKGESFENVALSVSEDPSVRLNRGDLGYFSAFKMVYNFEDSAYATEVGQVSNIFRTRFGYHLVKVTDKRKSKGEFDVAHILVRDKSIIGKVKIDSAYQKLKTGASFEDISKEFSEDTGTFKNGGKLPRFSTGTMVEQFENAVLGLKNINDFSEPFKTRFGWHIVKLLNKLPIESYEVARKKIEGKVKRSDRLQASYEAVLNKLKKKYDVKVNEEVFKQIETLSVKDFIAKNNKEWILSIDKVKVGGDKFNDYIKYRRNSNLSELFEQFKNYELTEYFKKDLVNLEPDFKHTLTEYKEGLLLFELMQKKIWKKATTDTLGLKKFFDGNKGNYKEQNLEDVKGEVISDYQQSLENDWLELLRNKNKIIIREKEVKKLKKIYNQ